MARLKPIDGADVYLWKYLPSIPAAILFLVLFAALTSAHCWRMVKMRAWFCSTFAVGGLCQILGYGVRIVSYFCTNQIAPYAVQSSLIVLAPAFYAVSIYMVLGRLIRRVHGERFSIVHPSRMTKLFVLCDLLTLNVQANGAGLTANKKLQKVGEYIVVAGLFLQLAVFGSFVAAAVIFHIRMRRYVVKESALRPDVPWRQGLKMLYTCSILIIVRSIFRVIGYLMGVDAYLLANEWPMYVFDAVPMSAVQVIFLVWFPDKFQPRQGDVGEDGHVLVENESPMR